MNSIGPARLSTGFAALTRPSKRTFIESTDREAGCSITATELHARAESCAQASSDKVPQRHVRAQRPRVGSATRAAPTRITVCDEHASSTGAATDHTSAVESLLRIARAVFKWPRCSHRCERTGRLHSSTTAAAKRGIGSRSRPHLRSMAAFRRRRRRARASAYDPPVIAARPARRPKSSFRTLRVEKGAQEGACASHALGRTASVTSPPERRAYRESHATAEKPLRRALRWLSG